MREGTEASLQRKRPRLNLSRLCTVGLAATLLLAVSNFNNPKIREGFTVDEPLPCDGDNALFLDRVTWSWRRTLRRSLKGEERLVLHIRLSSVAVLALWGVSVLGISFLKFSLLASSPRLHSGQCTIQITVYLACAQ